MEATVRVVGEVAASTADVAGSSLQTSADSVSQLSKDAVQLAALTQEAAIVAPAAAVPAVEPSAAVDAAAAVLSVAADTTPDVVPTMSSAVAASVAAAVASPPEAVLAAADPGVRTSAAFAAGGVDPQHSPRVCQGDLGEQATLICALTGMHGPHKQLQVLCLVLLADSACWGFLLSWQTQQVPVLFPVLGQHG